MREYNIGHIVGLKQGQRIILEARKWELESNLRHVKKQLEALNLELESMKEVTNE